MVFLSYSLLLEADPVSRHHESGGADGFCLGEGAGVWHFVCVCEKAVFQNNKNNTQAVIFASNIKSYHRKNEYEKPFSKSNRCCLFCSIDAMLGVDYDVLS